jgi:hypothetical protein
MSPPPDPHPTPDNLLAHPTRARASSASGLAVSQADQIDGHESAIRTVGGIAIEARDAAIAARSEAARACTLVRNLADVVEAQGRDNAEALGTIQSAFVHHEIQDAARMRQEREKSVRQAARGSSLQTLGGSLAIGMGGWFAHDPTGFVAFWRAVFGG